MSARVHELSIPPLGLYVHLPWCVRKCPYCDFNSYQAPDGALPQQAYVDDLLQDLRGDAVDVPRVPAGGQTLLYGLVFGRAALGPRGEGAHQAGRKAGQAAGDAPAAAGGRRRRRGPSEIEIASERTSYLFENGRSQVRSMSSADRAIGI